MRNRSAAGDSGRRKSVLLIDDDEALGAFLAPVFRELKIQLLTATTGAEGFALAQSVAPALVLLDLNLPDVADMSLLERLLILNPASHVVVISGDNAIQSTVGCVK